MQTFHLTLLTNFSITDHDLVFITESWSKAELKTKTHTPHQHTPSSCSSHLGLTYHVSIYLTFWILTLESRLFTHSSISFKFLDQVTAFYLGYILSNYSIIQSVIFLTILQYFLIVYWLSQWKWHYAMIATHFLLNKINVSSIKYTIFSLA